MGYEFQVRPIPFVAPFTALLGAAVTAWRCVHWLMLVAQCGWSCFERQPRVAELRDIRIAFGAKMALGLDFFLADDIIVAPVAIPSQGSLLLLGRIAVIRAAMAFFLAREIERNTNAGT